MNEFGEFREAMITSISEATQVPRHMLAPRSNLRNILATADDGSFYAYLSPYAGGGAMLYTLHRDGRRFHRSCAPAEHAAILERLDAKHNTEREVHLTPAPR